MWGRAIYDRWRRATVGQFPGLKGMPFEAAWARYRASARDARRALEPWYTVVHVAQGLALVVFLWIAWRASARPMTPVLPARWLLWLPWIMLALNTTFFGMAMLFQRKVKRCVSERLSIERGMGRLPECLRCGYDLRGNAGARCPECGAALV